MKHLKDFLLKRSLNIDKVWIVRRDQFVALYFCYVLQYKYHGIFARTGALIW